MAAAAASVMAAVNMSSAPSSSNDWELGFEEACEADIKAATQATIRNLGSGAATVDVGLFGQERVALRTLHLLPEESTVVVWRVPFQPERITVDPDVQVLQAGRLEASVELSPAVPAR